MKIRRFTAPDMRQAITRVRDELGPEAVILSNRKVDGEVEIGPRSTTRPAPRPVSPAVSYLAELSSRVAERHAETPPPERAASPPPAPSSGGELSALHEEVRLLKELVESQMMGLHQGPDGPRTPSIARIAKRLTELGLGEAWVQRILDRLPRQGPLDRLWSQALRQLAGFVPTRAPDFLRQGGVVVLVGPSGAGKTTTLAKIAAQYILGHHREGVVMVSCDDHRVGAHEQLRAYGQILGVPVYSTRARDELARVVPFPGLDGLAAEILLTLAAPLQPVAMAEYIRRYRGLGVTGAVLSKCDEALRLGPALSVLMDARLPAVLVTDGPAIPDDLHPAEARDLVNRSIDKVRRFRPVGTNPANETHSEHEGVASK